MKTILNHVQKFKSFAYGKVRWVGGADTPKLEVAGRDGPVPALHHEPEIPKICGE